MTNEIEKDECGNKGIEQEGTISNMPIIQLHGPDQWHGEQALVLNEEGRNRLIRALESGNDMAVVPAFCCDGEGFYLTIRILPFEKILRLRTPYIDDICHGGEKGYKDPRYSLSPDAHKEVERGEYAYLY